MSRPNIEKIEQYFRDHVEFSVMRGEAVLKLIEYIHHLESSNEIELVDIVYDGPPSNETGKFVEVEDQTGKSISVGTWLEREDGYWVLRIPTIKKSHYPKWMKTAGQVLNKLKPDIKKMCEPPPSLSPGKRSITYHVPKDEDVFTNGSLDAVKLMHKYPYSGICNNCKAVFTYIKGHVKPNSLMRSEDCINTDGTISQYQGTMRGCLCGEFSPALYDRQTGKLVKDLEGDNNE